MDEIRYIQTSDEDNETITLAVKLILKTMTLNAIPEHACLIACAKAMFIVADFNNFDEEDLRHIMNQIYDMYTKGRHKHHEI